jgi:hypothetical protein
MSSTRIGAVHIFIVTTVVLTASCGSSPAAPSAAILPQGPGPYHLKMTGSAASTVAGVPPCVGAVTDPSYVRAYLNISREGAMWVGRTTQGDFELRIRGDGTDVSGSLKGTAIDTAYPGGRKGMYPQFALTIKVGAATGSPASVKGVVDGTGHVGGTISGDIQYFDLLGNVTTCSAVVWSLEVVPDPLS